MTKFERLLSELNRLYTIFNEHFYHREIKTLPVLTVQTNGHYRNAMAWCSQRKIWLDHEKNEYHYEIAICSEYLFLPPEEICVNLLHEMVHLYANEQGIKTVSRGNTYHNQRFKEIAEEHGLCIEYNNRIGWSITKPTPDTLDFLKKNIDYEVFILTRGEHSPRDDEISSRGEEGEPKKDKEKSKKKSSRKYVCPKCGTIVRATKEVNIKCADCDTVFVEVC